MAAETYQMASCYVHQGAPVDTRLLHEHHKHPKGYGGSDDPDNLIWLCGSCHDLVHRLANYLRSKKIGLVSDLAYQYQTSQNLSPAGKQRLLELAKVAALSMDEFDPELMELDEEDTVLVQLPIPRSIHTQAKQLAAQYKNPGGKRQMGLYRYLVTVITSHVQLATNSPMHSNNPEKYFGVDKDYNEVGYTAADQGDLIPFE